MQPFSRVPVLAGVATVALALVAGPAFAVGPHPIEPAGITASTAPATVVPTVRVTPAHLSAHQYAKNGFVAHLSGFPASTPVSLGLGNGASGGPLDEGVEHATNPEGGLNIRYVPAKGAGLPATYTFTAFYMPVVAGVPAVTTSSAIDPATATRVPVTFTVKVSDAKVAWKPATRVGSSITLGATVQRWIPKAHAYVAWKNATVKFQERIDGTWKTKATVSTNSKGLAKRTVAAKVHTWRALVVSTTSTWGVASQAHKK